MLWYVIQTYTGKEEQLVQMIRRQLPKECYGECFVAYYEQLRDRHQENQIHILRLFPGYIFISAADVDRLFLELKRVPAMAKIMATGAFLFTPLHEGEMEFLMNVMDSDHIVRLTYAATDGKDHVSYLSGPLENCRDRIVSYRFRDRYADVRLQIAGIDKIVKMGIILNDDIRRELRYGKTETPVRRPEQYVLSVPAGNPFQAGDSVAVIGGTFQGGTAAVSRIGKDTVWITAHMFGREIPAEVSVKDVRKI